MGGCLGDGRPQLRSLTCLTAPRPDHKSFDIYVDALQVESVGEFVEEGSKYSFSMPNGASAAIAVLPAEGRSAKARVTLEVAGELVAEAGAMPSTPSVPKGK